MSHNHFALHLDTLKGSHDARHLSQKLKAASDAGFEGVSLSLEDVEAWVASGRHLRTLHHQVQELGLHVVEIGEVGILDKRGKVADRTREFAAALALGAPLVTVVYNHPSAGPQQIRADWTAFLELLSDVEGVRAGLHFKADSPNFNTLYMAWDLVGETPANSALVLDMYDFWKGGSGAGSLDAVPVEMLGMVHITDVRQVEREKALADDRVFPGEGVMPLTHIVTTLGRRGYAGPYSVEVIGECSQKGCVAVSREAFRTTRKLLGTSGPSHRKLPVAGALRMA